MIGQSDSFPRFHGALYLCDQNLDVELNDDKIELILFGTRQQSAKVNEYSIRVGDLNNCSEKFGACGSTLNHKQVRILLSLAHYGFCIKRRIGKLLSKPPINVTVFLMAYLTAKFRASRRWLDLFTRHKSSVSVLPYCLNCPSCHCDSALYSRPCFYIQNYPCRYKPAAAKEVAVLFQGRHSHSWSLRLNLGTCLPNKTTWKFHANMSLLLLNWFYYLLIQIVLCSWIQ